MITYNRKAVKKSYPPSEKTAKKQIKVYISDGTIYLPFSDTWKKTECKGNAKKCQRQPAYQRSLRSIKARIHTAFTFNSNNELRESINRLVNIFYIISSVLRKQPLERARSLLCMCKSCVFFSLYKFELCERSDTTRMCNAFVLNMNVTVVGSVAAVVAATMLLMLLCLFLIAPPVPCHILINVHEKKRETDALRSSYGFQLFSDMSHFNLNQSFYGMTE